MAYGQILGPQLDPEFDPEALRGLGAENRVLKVRTNSPFLFSFIYIKIWHWELRIQPRSDRTSPWMGVFGSFESKTDRPVDTFSGRQRKIWGNPALGFLIRVSY